MSDYDHQKIEAKWQKYWEDNKTFAALEDKGRDKFYSLVEFPYPSGDGLHVGHLRSYTAMDIICRYQRMNGKNVLYPIGFDAFGLPAENYAVKKNIKPQETTTKNIINFTRQLKSSGFSFDWERSLSTTDPSYYKWTQWIFVQMFKKGLAYKTKQAINWCVDCKIGLANEEVVNGVCERCGGEVVKKDKEQWLLQITKYADRLIDDLDNVDYLERIKSQQINWIGRSEGAEVNFQVAKSDQQIKVFTTRPDTLFGATYLVLAPEHQLLEKLKQNISNWDEITEYISEAQKKSDLERTDLVKDKTGIEIKGIRAINPVNSKAIPIWIADYVLASYGTGAIMAVPAHDERDFTFAKKYNIEIQQVVERATKDDLISAKASADKEVFTGDGIAINSGEYNGLTTAEFKKQIVKWLVKEKYGQAAVNYKLRDWVFSRQRYWGEPIPLIHCDECGWQPVPEEDLPVVLPEIDNFLPTEDGQSPLAKVEDWVYTKCPKCGGVGMRETDVMPNWAGSNWYFIRYADNHNDEQMVDPQKAEYWLPVDWYNGGMEHTTLHLLYSRFVYKFLYDIKAIPKKCGVEPYQKRTAHGMILGEGGVKMSKSKGNVVNPDDYLTKYGADTTRLYEMFMGPFDQAIAWDEKGVTGTSKFLSKIWSLRTKVAKQAEVNKNITTALHQTIKKVGEDIMNMRFNTAISQMMIMANLWEKENTIAPEDWQRFILILSPFAPHLAEEIWSELGHQESISKASWPLYDQKLIIADQFELVVQVNGKVRDKINVKVDISQQEVERLVKQLEKIEKYLDGKEIKKIIYIPNKLVNIVV
ncbi:MAG: leucine--tRNA ligase [Candidatus Komeilibacteria bacterium]